MITSSGTSTPAAIAPVLLEGEAVCSLEDCDPSLLCGALLLLPVALAAGELVVDEAEESSSSSSPPWLLVAVLVAPAAAMEPDAELLAPPEVEVCEAPDEVTVVPDRQLSV
jgi:hypothetical protein